MEKKIHKFTMIFILAFSFIFFFGCPGQIAGTESTEKNPTTEQTEIETEKKEDTNSQEKTKTEKEKTQTDKKEKTESNKTKIESDTTEKTESEPTKTDETNNEDNKKTDSTTTETTSPEQQTIITQPDVYYTITFLPNNEAVNSETASIKGKAYSIITLPLNGFILEGYIFTGWNTAADGSGTGYSNGDSLSLTCDLNLYAQWTLATVPTYEINIASTEHGTISVSNSVAKAGTEITVTLTPDEYYKFDSISVKEAAGTNIETKSVSGNTIIYTFSMPENSVTIAATFTQITYSVTFISNNTAATGITESLIAGAGSKITLTQNGFTLAGYTFTGWNTAADGSGTGYEDKASVRLTDNLTLYAQWILATIPTYSINTAITQNGIITVNKNIAEAGTEITVTLTPNELYALDSISIKSVDGSAIAATQVPGTVNAYTFTMPEQNVTVSATFKYIAHSITIAPTENGIVTVNKTVAVPGEEITLSVSPNELYAVDSISIKTSDGSTITATRKSEMSNVYVFSMPGKNVTVVVNFKYIAHSITVAPVENGSVTITKTVAIPGEEISFTISPNDNYALESILVSYTNGTRIETTKNTLSSNVYQFIMPENNVNICVTFKCIAHAISLTPVENGNVIISKNFALNGDEIRILVSADNDYQLDSISVIAEDGVIIPVTTEESNPNSFFFVMPEDNVLISVSFKLPTYTVYFDTGCLDYVPPQIVKKNCNATSPTCDGDSSTEGFIGWYSDIDCKNPYNFNTPITANIQLYAKWKKFAPLKSKIVEKISNLHYGCEIVIKEVIDENLLIEINTALRYLYSKKPDILISINFSNSIEGNLTGYNAFKDCKNLYEINFYYISRIGEECFSGCEKLWKVTGAMGSEIGDNAFYGCEYLHSITIKNTVTRIGKAAFKGCKTLSSINIPSNTIDVDDNAFYECIGLKSVTIDTRNNSTRIGNYAFYKTPLTNLTIPAGVSEIGTFAFANCYFLETVNLGQSITKIGDGAFSSCNKLSSISIPSSVETIGNNAFEYCIKLNTISLSTGLKSIGDNAFNNCKNLSSITIPNSVSKIGKSAFIGCINLETINIPANLLEIEDFTFGVCSKLKEIAIPEGVLKIGNGAFANCTSLSNINIPSSMTIIGKSAFSGCSSLSKVTFNDTTCKWNLDDALEIGPMSSSNFQQNASFLSETYKNYIWKKLEL